jgi:hypothetical protein
VVVGSSVVGRAVVVKGGLVVAAAVVVIGTGVVTGSAVVGTAVVVVVVLSGASWAMAATGIPAAAPVARPISALSTPRRLFAPASLREMSSSCDPSTMRSPSRTARRTFLPARRLASIHRFWN